MARKLREGSKAEEAREAVKEETRETKLERKGLAALKSPALHGRRTAAARR